ncbi:MAG: hypothetical protein AAGD25_10090 [Cyanobacteria bacterium P01_F01_bin.150]
MYDTAQDVLTYLFDYTLAFGCIAFFCLFVLASMEKIASQVSVSPHVGAECSCQESGVETEEDSSAMLGEQASSVVQGVDLAGTNGVGTLTIDLSGVQIYQLHKKDTVRVADLPCEVPSGVGLRKLRKEDAVYLRDLGAVATLLGVSS